MDEATIKSKAKEINDISLDYHLTHAVLACDKLLEEAFKTEGSKETNVIKDQLQKAYKENDLTKIKELLEKKKLLNLEKYHIFVDFIDMDVEAGRVVKAENKFVVSLPKKLADNARKGDSLFDQDNVQKLRRVMAHELGHIALHSGVLLTIENTNGSKELRGKFEDEANCFADELLRLRDERNKRLFKDCQVGGRKL
jgi:hypothetical protein